MIGYVIKSAETGEKMSNCSHNWVYVKTDIKIVDGKMIVVIDSYWYCTKCLEIKK